jgi:hypothetical protein
MSTRQHRLPSTTILLSDAANLDLQLRELNKLRDRVRHAQLLARKSRRKTIRKTTPT